MKCMHIDPETGHFGNGITVSHRVVVSQHVFLRVDPATARMDGIDGMDDDGDALSQPREKEGMHW